ncbi:thiamine kinase [Pantoea ananatis]|uniref:thiamine kinase n=1 Tax=Pantoea ananas TaxID=553 RepID=UPI0007631CF0|nr:thiamine kinase [Pantoea ananatis]AMB75426.1 thiamine kinase [Pantoea ananatis]MDC7869803.1 thiamine kinase [Pantoea ananatis]PKC43760.1 thiamine kinase [Pantoea ananatis BRT98]
MKLSGLETVSPKINAALLQLIKATTGEHRVTVTPLAGLTGQSCQIVTQNERLLLRPAPQSAIPFVNRQREGRVLRKLRLSGLVQRPLAGNRHGIILPWQDGEVMSDAGFRAARLQVLALLQRLHQQPLTGYRLSLLPLLWQYWQRCQQRQHRWLQQLQRLTRQGEPRPLRLAPLHMDVHPANLIQSEQGLHLIDWEYAADGDVALELAAVCLSDPTQQEQWLRDYAALMQIPLTSLQHQVSRWQPWLHLLVASWYQLRAEQSGDAHLQQLAQQSWQQI